MANNNVQQTRALKRFIFENYHFPKLLSATFGNVF